MTGPRSRAVALVATALLGVLTAASAAAPAPTPAAPTPAAPTPAALTTTRAPTTASTGGSTAGSTAALRCHDLVVAEVAALQTTTKTFTDAVRAGDVAAAKAAYTPARAHYETIAWVTADYEDVGTAIDGQANDASDPTRWRGFHRIEKALWGDGSLAGMAPYANELDLDIEVLKARVGRQAYRPLDMAVGAVDLLTTLSTTTVAGRENPYAHTDLADFAAGVAGAKMLFDLLGPELATQDPELTGRIEAQFADVAAALAAHRQGSGFADYSTVPTAARRTLSETLDALAEPLSHVGAELT